MGELTRRDRQVIGGSVLMLVAAGAGALATGSGGERVIAATDVLGQRPVTADAQLGAARAGLPADALSPQGLRSRGETSSIFIIPTTPPPYSGETGPALAQNGLPGSLLNGPPRTGNAPAAAPGGTAQAGGIAAGGIASGGNAAGDGGLGGDAAGGGGTAGNAPDVLAAGPGLPAPVDTAQVAPPVPTPAAVVTQGPDAGAVPIPGQEPAAANPLPDPPRHVAKPARHPVRTDERPRRADSDDDRGLFPFLPDAALPDAPDLGTPLPGAVPPPQIDEPGPFARSAPTADDAEAPAADDNEAPDAADTGATAADETRAPSTGDNDISADGNSADDRDAGGPAFHRHDNSGLSRQARADRTLDTRRPSAANRWTGAANRWAGSTARANHDDRPASDDRAGDDDRPGDDDRAGNDDRDGGFARARNRGWGAVGGLDGLRGMADRAGSLGDAIRSRITDSLDRAGIR
jgi:hypothetical protein